MVYSVPPNPNISKPVENILGSHRRVRVIEPPDYFESWLCVKYSSSVIRGLRWHSGRSAVLEKTCPCSKERNRKT